MKEKRPAACLLLLLGLTAIGCRDTGPRRVVYDLVDEARWIEPASEGSSAGFRVDPKTRLLFISQGRRIDFHLYIPDGHFLVFDRLGLRGDPSAEVRITLQRDGGEEIALGPLEPTGQPLEIRLPDGPGAIARLSFQGPSEGADGDGLAVWAPRIETRVEGPPRGAGGDPEGATPDADAVPPNVIIYLVDTLRKDHLGIYGYDIPITPAIDAFAAEATVYDNAVAQSTWTRPAVASVLTGLEPHIHGVNRRVESLPDPIRTLAEISAEKGYETAAFITNGNVSDEFNFDQGFATFSRSRKLRYFADQLNVRIFDYFAAGLPERPLLLYAHAVDPHGPYTPIDPFWACHAGDVDDVIVGDLEYLNAFRRRRVAPDRSILDQTVALYDAEIAFTDYHFGRFLNELRRLGLYDNSVIFFVADHGEEFWEHGDWSHGHSLHAELLDIPLIVKAPRQKEARRSARLAQHIDIFATALDYAGGEPGLHLRGRSLRRGPAAADPPPSVFSMIDLDGRMAVSVVTEGWKLMVPRSANMGRSSRLFDRRADPAEHHDLHAERPIVVGYLETLLRQHESAEALRISSEVTEMSEELIRELRALGYIQ